SVGDDQRAAMTGSFAVEQTGESVGVSVWIDVHRRATETAAVDQRRVIQFVREDDVVAADERGDDADVRRIAARERQRGLRGEEFGERAVELLMLGAVAGDESRCRRAGPGARRRDGRVAHQSRIGGQAEVVVRREVDERAALRLEHGASARGYRAKMALEIAV